MNRSNVKLWGIYWDKSLKRSCTVSYIGMDGFIAKLDYPDGLNKNGIYLYRECDDQLVKMIEDGD